MADKRSDPERLAQTWRERLWEWIVTTCGMILIASAMFSYSILVGYVVSWFFDVYWS